MKIQLDVRNGKVIGCVLMFASLIGKTIEEAALELKKHGYDEVTIKER